MSIPSGARRPHTRWQTYSTTPLKMASPAACGCYKVEGVLQRGIWGVESTQAVIGTGGPVK
eukprot:1192624-Prorocentrum_minimum.AAC.1